MAIGFVKAVVDSFVAGLRLQGQVEICRGMYHLMQAGGRSDHSPNAAAIENFERIATPEAVVRERARQADFDMFMHDAKEGVCHILGL